MERFGTIERLKKSMIALCGHRSNQITNGVVESTPQDGQRVESFGGSNLLGRNGASWEKEEEHGSLPRWTCAASV